MLKRRWPYGQGSIILKETFCRIYTVFRRRALINLHMNIDMQAWLHGTGSCLTSRWECRTMIMSTGILLPFAH